MFIQIDDQVKEAKGEALAYLEAWQAEANQALALELEAQIALQEQRSSAIEKLTKLGLTEAEVLALLGITETEPSTNKI